MKILKTVGIIIGVLLLLLTALYFIFRNPNPAGVPKTAVKIPAISIPSLSKVIEYVDWVDKSTQLGNFYTATGLLVTNDYYPQVQARQGK